MCHRVSVAAFDAAGDPDRYPGAGEPWQPLKLYYHMTFSKPRVVALHEALLAAGLESPYEQWLADWDDSRDKSHLITTRVPCAEWFPARDHALRAHATQVDPDGRWFHVPMEIQQRAWPTEDYHLARSLVGDTGPDEDDLFAGVREAVACRGAEPAARVARC
jgi:mycothiol S-conjugate amidase